MPAMLGAATAEIATGYGAYLLQTTLALIGVSALAVAVLWGLRRRGGVAGGGLRVVAQLTLEPRRSLYVVEAAGKYLLLGVGEGTMALLGELDAAQVRQIEAGEGAAAPFGLGDVIRRVLGKGPAK